MESLTNFMNEYTNVKVYMRDFQSSDVKEISTLLMKKLEHNQRLLELMRVGSPLTAEFERGFQP